MEITKEVTSLIELINKKVTDQSRRPIKINLPCKAMSRSELAQLLFVLAQEYGTTLPVLLRKLDRVSGDVHALDRVYSKKEQLLEWRPQEDQLLNRNTALLVRWKGEQAVELRKQYLQKKGKK